MNKNKLFEEELINAVNLEAAPPTEEPERQYYYIAKARKYVKELSEVIVAQRCPICDCAVYQIGLI